MWVCVSPGTGDEERRSGWTRAGALGPASQQHLVWLMLSQAGFLLPRHLHGRTAMRKTLQAGPQVTFWILSANELGTFVNRRPFIIQLCFSGIILYFIFLRTTPFYYHDTVLGLDMYAFLFKVSSDHYINSLPLLTVLWSKSNCFHFTDKKGRLRHLSKVSQQGNVKWSKNSEPGLPIPKPHSISLITLSVFNISFLAFLG